MQFKPAAKGAGSSAASGFLHPPLTKNLIDEAIEDALEIGHDLELSIYILKCVEQFYRKKLARRLDFYKSAND
jgi:hypothetical protein